jgi:hypothetical protein
MAYVMNPNNYRLGYSSSWSDNWYANKKVYPVVLQNMLTIRGFITFLLTKKKFEKLDIYLSHLHISIKSSRLLVILFFYDTILDYKKIARGLRIIQNKVHVGAPPIPYS